MNAPQTPPLEKVLANPRRFSGRLIGLAVLAIVLAILWGSGVLNDQLDNWVKPPGAPDSPFVITTYPKGYPAS